MRPKPPVNTTPLRRTAAIERSTRETTPGVHPANSIVDSCKRESAARVLDFAYHRILIGLGHLQRVVTIGVA